MADWWDYAVTGVDWWQRRDAIDDAQRVIDKGYKQGRKDVKKYTDPIWDRGLEHGEAYDEMGEFEYDFDDYMNSDYVDYALDKGSDAVLRTQAAGKSADSGATLTRLNEFAQNEIGSQYEQDFRRQLDAYGENKEYHQFPMEQGAQQGQFAGQYLSDMAIGRGSAYASMEMANAANNTTAMQNLTGGGQDSPGAISGAVQEVMDATGMDLKSAASFVADKAGIGIDAIKGIVTTGANKIAGAAWGVFGSGPQTLGGAAAASGSTAAGTAAAGGAAWGSTSLAAFGASVALGGAILGGIALLNNALGSDPEIGKMFRNLSKKGDPLKRMYSSGFNETWGSQFRNLFARDSAGRTSNQVSHAAKGVLASNLILNVNDPEAMTQLQHREDLPTIVNSMMTAMGSGLQINRKYASSEGIQSTSAGMIKLFPELEAEITAYENISRANRRIVSEQDSFGDLPMWQQLGGMSEPDYQAQQAAQTTLRNAINKQLDEWEAERIAGA